MDRYIMLAHYTIFLSLAAAMLTNSVSSLTAKAAEESATDISTSSTSFEISPKAFFHSSAKGPVEVPLGMVPTFFCAAVSRLARLRRAYGTCAGPFDKIKAFLKMLSILFRVLTTDQNLDWNLASLQRLKMLR